MYWYESELSLDDLWWHYFELGGMGTKFELDAFVIGVLQPTPHDHDIIALALNERLVELGSTHPVPYSDAR
jgi:hypothetical protein